MTAVIKRYHATTTRSTVTRGAKGALLSSVSGRSCGRLSWMMTGRAYLRAH